MRYVIDEIIDDKVILESLSDRSVIVVDISFLPEKIHEGSVVLKKEKFELDLDYEYKRKKLLTDKLNKLKELE